MEPAEEVESPTYALQVRCTTIVLCWPLEMVLRLAVYSLCPIRTMG